MKVWDEIKMRGLQTLSGHSGAVNSVAYSPDGKRPGSASTNGTVQVFTLDVCELLNLARSRVTRNLTSGQEKGGEPLLPNGDLPGTSVRFA